MKKLLSIIAFLLALVCLLGTGTMCFASADDKPDYSFQDTYNWGITQKILCGEGEGAQTRANSAETKNFTINLFKDGRQTDVVEDEFIEQVYTGTGLINIFGKDEDFSVGGTLLEVPTESNSVGLIGNLTGETESGTFLVITLHAIPGEEKFLAYVSVGFVTNDTNPDILIFGDSFDGMSKLTEIFFSYLNKMQIATEDGTGKQAWEAETEQINQYSTAATSGNTRLRAYDSTSLTDTSGKKYNIATLSLYTPINIKPRLNYDFGVKINANMQNAKKYAFSQYRIQAGSVLATSGMVEMICKSNSTLDFMQVDPESSSFNATLSVPLSSIPKLNAVAQFFPVDITVGISGIKAEKMKDNGSYRFNHVKWMHSYSHNVDYGTDGAIKSSNGYSGRSVGTWLVDSNKKVSVQFVANGYITFTYNSASYVTGEAISGTFTVYVNNVNTNISVEASS